MWRPLLRAAAHDPSRLFRISPEIQDLGLTPEKLRRDPELLETVLDANELAERIAIADARRDPNSFAEYVFKQEQEPFHELWQALVSTYPDVSIDAPVEHGKSTQISVIRSCWDIGRDVFELIAIISHNTDIPERCVRMISQTINESAEYHRVFPHVHIIKDTQSEIFVRRPRSGAKDPTVQARGIGGSILGSRLTRLVFDDILDFHNTYSENERKKIWDVITSTLVNRVIEGGSRRDIGTPWHVTDARHRLPDELGYVKAHFDAEDGERFRLNGVTHAIPGGKGRRTLWDRTVVDAVSGKIFGWPLERLRKRRMRLPSLEYNRQFRCIALSGTLSIFRADVLQYCKGLWDTGRRFNVEEYEGGRVRCVWRRPDRPEDIVVTGVDLAIAIKDTAHDTAFFTGTPYMGRREILEVRVGQMELVEIARAVIQIVRRYPQHRGFRVENNGAQDYLLQILRNPDMMRAIGATELDLQRIVVVPHYTTGYNKNDPVTGVRGMAIYFEQGRWPIPRDETGACPPLVQEWYDGMVSFDPQAHTNDILMASWLFAEECRSYGEGLEEMGGMVVGIDA